MKKIVAFFLIFAIATLSILPTTVYSQTKVNQDIFESKQNNLKTILEKEKLNRFNSLLDNTIENASPIDTNSNFLKNTPMLRRGAGKKVWIPVLIGVGVGIYFLIKYYKPSSSGILCSDGTYSQAENRQGACSYHGGIAPGH